jgi:hypothetical protein
MPSVTLEMVNYAGDDGALNGEVLHDLVHDLDVRFDDVAPLMTPPPDMPWVTVAAWTQLHVEFTGPREDLVTLIDRYEEDAGLRPGLYEMIVGS